MLKATREAKVNTSWISPNEPFESATRNFVAGILAESPRNLFLADFKTFTRQIADLGIWNSLAQTLLKLTSPGVPDIFQGTELFDFSLVFTTGEYIPLEASGSRRDHVCAFLRKRVDTATVTVVPRLVAGLAGMTGQPPLGHEIWKETRLALPNHFAGARFTNLLTGEMLEVTGDLRDTGLPLAEVFRTYPVALLEKCSPL
jgi:maltooligosyltrehalose synthase